MTVNTTNRSGVESAAEVPMALSADPPVFAYEYSILRYSQDPGSGEFLNIGVVLYSKDATFLAVRLQNRISRLSCAFPAFDPDQYNRVIGRFDTGIQTWQAKINQAAAPDALPLLDVPDRLEGVIRSLWDDQGLSYQYGSILSGVSDDLTDSLDALFERFVRSQYEKTKRMKRDDKDVWTGTYRDALRRTNVIDHLHEHTFTVNEFDYKFDFTFKNGHWNAIQPVSLDYAEKSGIRDRVDKLLGEAKVLSSREDIGMLYLLLGKPSNPDYLQTYQNAVKLLDTIDLEHRIVEEEQAEPFSEDLAEKMEQYGIIKVG